MRCWYRNPASLGLAAFFIVSLLFSPLSLKAEETQRDVDDLYIEVYNTILGADEAWQMGKKRDAYELYQRAQEFLENIKKEFPSWNQKLIDFRLSYVKTKMEQFTPPALDEAPPVSPAIETPDSPFAPDISGDAENQIRSLKAQLAQLEKIRDDLGPVFVKRPLLNQPPPTPESLKKLKKQLPSSSKPMPCSNSRWTTSAKALPRKPTKNRLCRPEKSDVWIKLAKRLKNSMPR